MTHAHTRPMTLRKRMHAIAHTMFCMLPVLVFLACALPHASYAESPPATPDDTCFGMTGSSGMSPGEPPLTPPPGEGLLSTIATDMQSILNTVAAQIYSGIVGDSTFQAAVRAAVTLYIAIYGLMFMMGMTQITLYDFMVRAIKIIIIKLLLDPSSWNFFGYYLVGFFNSSTDDIINAVTSIAVGGVVTPSGGPFVALDGAITKAVSPQMVVTMMATFGTGPNGILIGLLMVAALGSFMKSLLNALWVYVMSLVMKALLFGLAPIFIACLLFSRTRHLFDGWLNQIVNATLQPLLLFTFFAFFAMLIAASLDNILATPVCWSEFAESLRGSPFSQHFWRFAIMGGSGWEPFSGMVDFTGDPSGRPFPIDVMAVLIFLMLAELAGRFNGIAIEIAKDLAGAATNLSGIGGSATDLFAGVQKAMGSGGGGGGLGGLLGGGGGMGGGGGGGGGGVGMASTDFTNRARGGTNRPVVNTGGMDPGSVA